MKIDLDQYAEINPERFARIGAVCKQLALDDQAITRESLQASLPPDFALDDLDPWNQIAGEVRQAITSGSLRATETPDTATPAPSPVAPDPASREALAEKLLSLQRRCAELHGELHGLTIARAEAREALGDALATWQTGRPRITPNQLAHDYCAQSVRDRAERHVAGHPIAGPSTLDRQCTYSGPAGSAGDGTDFARKQMGRGHRRNAYPSSMRSATIRRDR